MKLSLNNRLGFLFLVLIFSVKLEIGVEFPFYMFLTCAVLSAIWMLADFGLDDQVSSPSKDKFEKLIELLKEGYELSRWTASINWSGGQNTQEWLASLDNKIDSFQNNYTEFMGGEK